MGENVIQSIKVDKSAWKLVLEALDFRVEEDQRVFSPDVGVVRCFGCGKDIRANKIGAIVPCDHNVWHKEVKAAFSCANEGCVILTTIHSSVEFDKEIIPDKGKPLVVPS